MTGDNPFEALGSSLRSLTLAVREGESLDGTLEAARDAGFRVTTVEAGGGGAEVTLERWRPPEVDPDDMVRLDPWREGGPVGFVDDSSGGATVSGLFGADGAVAGSLGVSGSDGFGVFSDDFDPTTCPECGMPAVVTPGDGGPRCLLHGGFEAEDPVDEPVEPERRCQGLGRRCRFCGETLPEPGDGPRACPERGGDS